MYVYILGVSSFLRTLQNTDDAKRIRVTELRIGKEIKFSRIKDENRKDRFETIIVKARQKDKMKKKSVSVLIVR